MIAVMFTQLRIGENDKLVLFWVDFLVGKIVKMIDWSSQVSQTCLARQEKQTQTY